jgi:hypothetical protein
MDAEEADLSWTALASGLLGPRGDTTGAFTVPIRSVRPPSPAAPYPPGMQERLSHPKPDHEGAPPAERLNQTEPRRPENQQAPGRWAFNPWRRTHVSPLIRLRVDELCGGVLTPYFLITHSTSLPLSRLSGEQAAAHRTRR